MDPKEFAQQVAEAMAPLIKAAVKEAMQEHQADCDRAERSKDLQKSIAQGIAQAASGNDTSFV